MATKSQELVPVTAGPMATHFRRLIQKTMGATEEVIAKSEGVSIEIVKKSIRVAEIYRESNSLDFANIAVGHIAVSLSPDVEHSIKKALRAKKTTKRYYRKNGQLQERSVVVDDHETQLQAVSQYRGLVESIQPKGSKVNVNATASASASASSFSESSYQPGVEEKIDQIRSRVEEVNRGPRELATIKDDDADIIEGDPKDVSTEDDESLDEEGDSPESVEMSP